MVTMATMSLTEIMSYDHPALVQRLEEKLGISRDGADELLDDTKRFLFLCGTTTGILAPPPRIDEGWHQFILYTKEYHDFCHRFFGRFIHHLPKTADEVLKSDGSAVRTTLATARKFLGDSLSTNWEFAQEGNCSDQCEPSTNCQPDKCERCSSEE